MHACMSACMYISVCRYVCMHVCMYTVVSWLGSHFEKREGIVDAVCKDYVHMYVCRDV